VERSLESVFLELTGADADAAGAGDDSRTEVA
jgi:hypothetical protein